MRKNKQQNTIWLDGSNKKFAGGISVTNAEEFEKLKVSAKPDALVIDTRVVKDPVLFRFYRVNQDLIVRASADGKSAAEPLSFSAPRKKGWLNPFLIYFADKISKNLRF